ncbi:YbhB/YbcL family Raf kinase inhibitor-like protein [Antrihabitans stalactiti]|nr:YbhB/YbcL family Raf kinase inhibitor-like protein [Antrihabitans stalactiti]
MATPIFGRLLRPVRAGVGRTAWHHRATNQAPECITVTSAAFLEGAPIPRRYAGHDVGDNISPPLRWSGAPDNTTELILVVEDPDAPLPRPVVHGLFFAISAAGRGELREGELSAADGPARVGLGSFKRRGYSGPRPVPGHGPHRYIFQLFALDRPSGLGEHATLAEAMAAIEGLVIGRGRLIGTYERG